MPLWYSKLPYGSSDKRRTDAMHLLRRTRISYFASPRGIYMSTTAKRISVYLTEKDIRELEFLMEKFGENQTQVFKRALILLSFITMENEKGTCKPA